MVGDVCLPLVLRILEGLGINYPCEPLTSMVADFATPVSDCRICLQIGKSIIVESLSDPVIETNGNSQHNEWPHQLEFPETPHPRRT